MLAWGCEILSDSIAPPLNPSGPEIFHPVSSLSPLMESSSRVSKQRSVLYFLNHQPLRGALSLWYGDQNCVPNYINNSLFLFLVPILAHSCNDL